MMKTFWIICSIVGGGLLWFYNRLPQNELVTLAENFLPWFGLISIFFILLLFKYHRDKSAALLLIYPLVSIVMFAPALFPVSKITDKNAVKLVTVNIDADNKTVDKALQNILAQDADLVGIEEISDSTLQNITNTMNANYPYNHIFGSVGLWSKYPITESDRADMPMNEGRVLTANVALPQGNTQVYVSHMGSYRPYMHAQRDIMLNQIAQVMKSDPNKKAIIMGDFNASTYDSHFQQVRKTWAETQSTKFGPNFTWPSNFPVTKIDHVLYKGFNKGTSQTFVVSGSDHRGISAQVD
ncbi:MAG: endonuclease/exonuclease/phosphatase family protein [Micrococcaceae bacterium]